MRDNEKAVYLEIDKKLWYDFGVYAVINNTSKKELITKAVMQYLNVKEENK